MVISDYPFLSFNVTTSCCNILAYLRLSFLISTIDGQTEALIVKRRGHKRELLLFQFFFFDICLLFINFACYKTGGKTVHKLSTQSWKDFTTSTQMEDVEPPAPIEPPASTHTHTHTHKKKKIVLEYDSDESSSDEDNAAEEKRLDEDDAAEEKRLLAMLLALKRKRKRKIRRTNKGKVKSKKPKQALVRRTRAVELSTDSSSSSSSSITDPKEEKKIQNVI